METDILKEFVSLAETCSFQETADRLHVSQSALTKHIHKLEKDLGVSLFDRSTRSVTLNEYSEALLPYARQAADLDTEMREAMKRISDRHASILNITFTPTAAHYGIIDVLSYFTRMHPEIELKITENTKSIEALANNECDFVFAAENASIDSRFTKIVYQKDYIAIILPGTHPLAAQDTVSLTDIAGERIVLHVNSRGGLHSGTRKLLEQFEKNNMKPQIASTASFTSTVIKFVEHGNCIAALPANRIPQDAYGVRIVDLVPYIYSYLYLLYPAGKRLSGPEKIFVDFIRESAEADEDEGL